MIELPRTPTPEDVRTAELELMDQLILEQRQPEVPPWPWGRFAGLLDLVDEEAA